MVRYWSTKKAVGSTADDTRTLSLHVLSSAGFGKSYPFQGHDDKSSSDVATNYKESLQTILDHCVFSSSEPTSYPRNGYGKRFKSSTKQC